MESEKPEKKEPRIFVFIDCENMRNTAESKSYADLDYDKIHKWFFEKLKVKRVYLYVGIDKGDIKKEDKFKKLSQLGYNVFVKKVMTYTQKPFSYEFECNNCHARQLERIPRHGKQKANCDSELTLDLINQTVRKKCDEVIIFSGDGDFARAYEYVANSLKKKVTVYSTFDERTSTKLKRMHEDKLIALEDVTSLYQHYAERVTLSLN